MEENNKLEFDGQCAFALSIGRTPPVTNKKHFLTVDGKTYTFLNRMAKFVFKLSLKKNIEKAEKNWANNKF
jgi:hypothetical protein